MAWTLKAPQLGSATVISSTVVVGGEIYGATNLGTLVKWDGVSAWTQVAAIYLATYTRVYSMVVHSGTIYAAVGPPAAVAEVVYFNGSAWIDAGFSAATISSTLVLYSTGLYAVGGALDGSADGVARLLPTNASVVSSVPSSTATTCALEFSALMFVCFTDGTVRTNNGVSSAYTTAHTFTGEYGTSIATHAGELYVGTSDGNLYKWNGSAFVVQADVGSAIPITSLLSFNSKLYAGVSQV